MLAVDSVSSDLMRRTHTAALAVLMLSFLMSCSSPGEAEEIGTQSIEPEQSHVPVEYRCPAVEISEARSTDLASGDARYERVVERMISDGELAVDPEHRRRQGMEGPVPFALGPHRFALDRKFFYFQNAPAAVPTDQSVTLSLQWPCFEPLPVRVDFADHPDTSVRAVSINVEYVAPERVSIESVMRRQVEPLDPADPGQRAHPLMNLDLRIGGDEVHGGLKPFYADVDAFERHLGGRVSNERRRRELALGSSVDWFVRVNDKGAPRTFIACGNRALPDGLIVSGNVVTDDPAIPRRQSCDHALSLPELDIIVRMSYMRAFLPDWGRLEQRVEQLLTSALTTPAGER